VTIRIEGLLNTDKMFYRPNDYIFAKVLLLNSQTKTPLAMSAPEALNHAFNITFEVYDNINRQLYSNKSQASAATAVFTYQLPNTSVSRDYTLRVYSTGLPVIYKNIRVVDLLKRHHIFNHLQCWLASDWSDLAFKLEWLKFLNSTHL